ncbi:MAG: SDR family oxidoreductase [Elusimicrobia bacterium]|nr:SDR family oxidoreductase [Elusimicrobiota bacterium]
MSLRGRVVLVTGAGRRVGRAIALAFAERGARLAVHYHRSAAQARAAAQAARRASGAEAAAFRADLADPRTPRLLAAAVARRFGGLDVLVNCASVYEKTPLGRAVPADWDRHMAVNARAPFFLAQACAPYLRRRDGGVILNVADWSALRPYADYAPYCASKAALLCVNKALAKALAPRIRVNAVLPGPVLLPEGTGAARRELIREATLLKRLGSPGAVARACVFLAESADYTTGAELTVDGGRLIA